MVFKSVENRKTELIPVGEYNAVCTGVIDVGKQSYKGSEPSPQIVVLFEIDYRYKTGDYAGKRFVKGLTMTPVISKNSKLKKLIESWFDTVIKDPKNFQIDSNSFVGRSASIYITIEPKSDGGKKNTIIAVTKAKTKVEIETPGYIPEWVKDKIRNQVVDGGQTIDLKDDYYDDPNAAFEQANKTDNAGIDYRSLSDEDVPFAGDSDCWRF